MRYTPRADLTVLLPFQLAMGLSVNSRVTIVESRFARTLMITSSWYVSAMPVRPCAGIQWNCAFSPVVYRRRFGARSPN